MERPTQGTYIRTSTGGETVRAFVPSPLPPSPPIDWTPQLLQAFENAQLAIGRLDSVSLLMTEVCNPDYGLFPKPSKMELSCSCPDWAKMCKHVTACLYAVGRLLDTKPECLFTLRGVDASNLFAAADLDVPDATDTAFDGTDMGELFGIDLEEEPAKSQQKSKKNKSNV